MVQRPVKPFRKARFQLDDGPSFEGYTRDDYWNGWACPYFTEANARKVMKFLYGFPGAWWRFQNGKFVGYNPENEVYADEGPVLDEWEGQFIATNGRRIKVYAIGAFSHCWDEADTRSGSSAPRKRPAARTGAQAPLKKPASRPKKPSKPKMKPAPRTGSGKAPKRR